MKQDAIITSEYLGPYIGFNIFAVTLVFLAIKWPRLARALFVLIFLAAGLFNIYTALTQPEEYLNYGDMAVLELYSSFINGFFREYTQLIVLVIALGQLSIAALLSGNGNRLRLGAVGGVVFFFAIAPLGIGSAFPTSLIMAVALIVMQRPLIKNNNVRPDKQKAK
jgi:hypothetical protein